MQNSSKLLGGFPNSQKSEILLIFLTRAKLIPVIRQFVKFQYGVCACMPLLCLSIYPIQLSVRILHFCLWRKIYSDPFWNGSCLRSCNVLRSTKGSSLQRVRCFAVWVTVPKAEVWIPKCLTHIPNTVTKWVNTNRQCAKNGCQALPLRQIFPLTPAVECAGLESLSLGWWKRDNTEPFSNFWTPYSDSYDLHSCPSRDGQCWNKGMLVKVYI